MSTQGYSIDFNEDLILRKNFSTIMEEDDDNDDDAEMEVRNNIEDVVGADDISSDDESSLSDEDDYQRQIEIRNNIQSVIGPNDLSSSDEEPESVSDKKLNNEHNLDHDSSSGISNDPFSTGNNSGDFPQPITFPESPTNLHITLSNSQTSLSGETVENQEYNLANSLNIAMKEIGRFNGLDTNQLQHEFFQSGSAKERLEILYKTRGREIDDLKAQLEYIKKSSKLACDKLSNALKSSKVKVEMMSASEKQLKDLLEKYEGKVRSFNAEVMTKNETISKLEFDNITLKDELESVKGTVFSLQQHAADLTSVKSLAKSKQIQEDFVQKLHNMHKEELEERNIQYKRSLLKLDNLKQEIERLESELQASKEQHSNTLQNKELTIKSLQMSNLRKAENDTVAENLRSRNEELDKKLEMLQHKYEITKQNLDCCDLINKMNIYKESVPDENSLDHMGLIKALDFDNVSSVEVDPTGQVTPQKVSQNLKLLAESFQKSVFCNKKFREENLQLQKLITEKDSKIKYFQDVINQQTELSLNQCTREEQAINSEALHFLQQENVILNERIKNTEFKLQIQKEKINKSTNTECATKERNLNLSNMEISENSLSEEKLNNDVSLIKKYHISLENEKLKKEELEIYYKNHIKELIDKFGNITAVTASSTQANGNQAEISDLKSKINQYEKDKQKLIAHYEDDIRQITDTLMDKEGEIQEVKSKLKTNTCTCELLTSVISELNLNQAKLSKTNELLNDQLSAGKLFIKEKLKEYREKYECRLASFEKYKVKADERIVYNLKMAQRVAKEMEAANLETIEQIKSWLNFSRLNIIKSIDVICLKLKQFPVSYEPSTCHNALISVKELVLKLHLEHIETHYHQLK